MAYPMRPPKEARSTASYEKHKAIPHKERTTKRTKKGYNKEVKGHVRVRFF